MFFTIFIVVTKTNMVTKRAVVTKGAVVTKSDFSEIDKIPTETQPVVTKLPRGRINLIFTLPHMMKLFVVGYKTG